MKSTPGASRLSATDAFFVAYQESSHVLMQLGVEVEFKGCITRYDLDQALRHVVRRWPPLGQRLHQGFCGLSWKGESLTNEMIHVAERREVLAGWRNRPLNPFVEPPFQLLWISDGVQSLLAFRAHHAVVDGEGFFAVCAEAVRTLAEICGARPGAASIHDQESDTRATSSRRTPKRRPIGEALQNLQHLRDERHSHHTARLAMINCTPGDIAIVERDLEHDDFRELKRQATELGIAPGWLCASAWIRAIHAWNLSRGEGQNPLISIEVPVSLRRGHAVEIGNLISPLMLYGNAKEPLEVLAADLKQQMNREVRRQAHLAVPRLSSPGKFLPWRLFRRLVANTELTGFATSHFTWLEQSLTIHDDVERLSGGALQIVAQQIYTPVCLYMGAAMAILAWPERAQIFITYRLTALSRTDAQTLSDLMVQELGQRYLSRRQVAV